MAIHILVFPYPAQGHMLALIDLTRRLAAHPDLTITVLVTPKNLPSLSSLLAAHPSIQTLVLPFPPHPSLPPAAENLREIGNSGNVHVISSLHRLRDPIIHWFRSHPNPPVAILSDFFLGWSCQLAADLGIPRLAFFSVSALYVSLIHHCWVNLGFIRSLDVVTFSDLPGAPTFKESQLPSIFRLYKELDPEWELIKTSMIENLSSSSGCIVNTFDAFESEFLDRLRKKTSSVYAVGPLSLTDQNPGRGIESGLRTWLDSCPDGSVLYICFGSQKLMSEEQLEGLAAALDKSGVRFVWVVKLNESSTGSVILNGFEDRVSGRGKVATGWVPQVDVLNHRAVGYFLSHCGWNSLQEAVVAGVAVLAWPMEADQYVNARLIVEELGVAVRVCEGADTVPDPDEMGRAIAAFVKEEGSEEKERAKVMKEKAAAAVKPGGSSTREFDRLMDELRNLGQPKHDLVGDQDSGVKAETYGRV